MGLPASQARVLLLIARRSDLELTAQLINQQRLSLTAKTLDLFTLSASPKLDPDSPEAKLLQARIKRLQQIDKRLELQLQHVSTQQKAISTEMETLKKIITDNIQSSFKTFS